jgi:mannose-6-phosphate isomerase-like protein (cupin superfamily)
MPNRGIGYLNSTAEAASNGPTAAAARAAFPRGTVLFNPTTGEYGRVLEHSDTRLVGEMIAKPGAAVAGPHRHPHQEEHFEVLDGILGYRRGTERGELGASEELTIPAGVVHDWWNAGESDLHVIVSVTPPGRFAAMIAAVWGLAACGRTNTKGMPGLLDGALLLEVFGDEIIFERPPAAIQLAFAKIIAPFARRRGRSVSDEDVLRAAVVTAERWPGAGVSPSAIRSTG